MSKVLFIEDELVLNIETIVRLFSPILNEAILQKLQSSNFHYPEEIVELCSQNSPLDIAYSFPMALEKILTNHQNYDLILIDRNLEETPYDEDMEQIFTILEEKNITDIRERFDSLFKQREGDLILQILLTEDRNAKNKTYFLTANNEDAIRDSMKLETILESKLFFKENIIEKSSEKEGIIPKMLMDLPSLRIQNEFYDQCTIIRKRLGEDWVDKFVKMIQHYRDGNKEECVLFLRMLLGNKILKEIAIKMDEMSGSKGSYWNDVNPNQLVTKGFIKRGLPSKKWKNKLGYNSVIKNACLSIAEICSDCIHGEFDNFNIEIYPNDVDTSVLSHYTMRTLMNQMLDVIIWYNMVLEVFPK